MAPRQRVWTLVGTPPRRGSTSCLGQFATAFVVDRTDEPVTHPGLVRGAAAVKIHPTVTLFAAGKVETPGWSGPGVSGEAMLVAGRGFEPLTFGL